MRTVKIKSGGHILIFPSREEFKEEEICFTEEEYSWAVKMQAGSRDPEEIRSFWATLLEKKRNHPEYCFLVDFPKEAPKQELEKAPKAETETQRMARETCEMFAARRAFPEKKNA